MIYRIKNADGGDVLKVKMVARMMGDVVHIERTMQCIRVKILYTTGDVVHK